MSEPAGARLRRLRFSKGWTQSELAGRIDAGSHTTIRNWEMSTSTPRPAMRRRLAEVLGEDVYGGEA